MSSLLLTLPSLGLILLGAHFYRASLWPLVALCGLALVLMWCLRRPWVARLLQWSLLLGAAEWLWTVIVLAQQRLASGMPWQRMALILLAVALFTAAAAVVFRHPRLRQRFACG